MTQSPDPINSHNLTRASYIGIAVAIIGIVLFIVIWIVLGSVGVDQVPRIVVSVCLPPALMALAVGGYFLLVPSHKQGDE